MAPRATTSGRATEGGDLDFVAKPVDFDALKDRLR